MTDLNTKDQAHACSTSQNGISGWTQITIGQTDDNESEPTYGPRHLLTRPARYLDDVM